MNYSICFVPVSPLRSEPLHESEMVSQLIFGECAEIIEAIGEEWFKVRCKHDGYIGYCQSTHVMTIDEDLYNSSSKRLIREWSGKLEWNGNAIHVPMGSVLTGMQNGSAKWGNHTITYNGKPWIPVERKPDAELIWQLVSDYFHTGYLWGGRTVYGADCSGFSQMIYRFLDIFLPRDASQQVTLGEKLEALRQANIGDLAFFDDGHGKVIHVGILLEKDQIIHASGRVRIDRIDDEGIINTESGKHSYHLHSVRCYF